MIDLSKRRKLEGILAEIGSALVAFSGGVDSTFLLKTAADVLGDRVTAVTADSAVFTRTEIAEARDLARRLGVRHLVLATAQMDDPGFTANGPERCYVCKRRMLSRLLALAEERGSEVVLEGSVADDAPGDRPGLRAVAELGVRSPLAEAGLTKAAVRALSEEMGLTTWNKPSSPCLATRIPYGAPITAAKLRRIEEAEDAVRQCGVREFRVRDHGPIARLEVVGDELAALLDEDRRDTIASALRGLGFTYVCIDLEGYRTRSMGEPLGRRD